MTGLPKLPGYTFSDPTLTKFHLPQTFGLCNGYKLPKNDFCGIGGREIDSNSVKFIPKYDITRFDPSLTYGRTRSKNVKKFLPHYALYDQKCLTFKAFFQQSIPESPDEFRRVRHVNIIYFLEDDTITVIEPKVENSGMDQGKLVRRCKIPKDDRGNFYHWKDLNIGKDFAFFGIVYHTVDCDLFTKEYLASQGIILNGAEQSPVDRYIQKRMVQNMRTVGKKTTSEYDKLRRFLEYDGKILKFKAVWDDRENEYGLLMKYEIHYFLSDDTVSVKEIHDKNDGRDPFPLLLRKCKLPKRYNDTPTTYPAIYMEISDAEVTEYYQPKDFQVGETIFVLGRDMLIYDCDKFTRDYFRNALGIEQKPLLDIFDSKASHPEPQVPPHDGLGSLEDSLQNTLTFMPKKPKKDVIRQLVNANKYLRYEMVMDAVHPEDTIRKFVLSYSLADGTCKIAEPPIRNSGILGGKYLTSTYLIKPGSDPLNPDFYTPVDFFIGAIIEVFSQRFKIVGADLYVYRYMERNSSKFPCEVIESIRNYLFNKGYLEGEVDDQVKEKLESQRKYDAEADGDYQKRTDMEECMERLKVTKADDPQERAIMDQLRNEYEKSIEHKSQLPPYGIKEVSKVCPYPVEFGGQVKSGVCKEEIEREYTSYTPKHIDTPEEKIQKYYQGVLNEQKELCTDGREIECLEPPVREVRLDTIEEKQKPKPIMVTNPDIVQQKDCFKKTVTFVDDRNRCFVDQNDICDLKREKTHRDCSTYEKCL